MKNKYNFGGISGMGKIVGENVISPDLRKMSSRDLSAWKRKISRLWNLCSLSSQNDPKNPYAIEYGRIRHFLRRKEKEIVINKKDMIDLVKRKRRMRTDDIAIEDFSIRYYPDDNKKESEIVVTYFAGNKK